MIKAREIERALPISDPEPAGLAFGRQTVLLQSSAAMSSRPSEGSSRGSHPAAGYRGPLQESARAAARFQDLERSQDLGRFPEWVVGCSHNRVAAAVGAYQVGERNHLELGGQEKDIHVVESIQVWFLWSRSRRGLLIVGIKLY